MNMNGGNATIGGSIFGHVNGSKQTGVTVSIPSFEHTLLSHSQSLSGQAANSGVTLANGRATFASRSSGLSVFDVSADDLSGLNEIAFAGDDEAPILINVTGDSAKVHANFLGNASHVLWNFVDAGHISFDSQFDGSILAPNAAIKNSNALNGSVVARSFDQQGEVHLPAFYSWLAPGAGSGIDVPAPQAWLLFLLAVMAMAFLSYRRKVKLRASKPQSPACRRPPTHLLRSAQRLLHERNGQPPMGRE